MNKESQIVTRYIIILAIMSDEFQVRLERFNELINEFAEIIVKEDQELKAEKEIATSKPTDFTIKGDLNEQLINLYNENTKLKHQIKRLETELDNIRKELVTNSR